MTTAVSTRTISDDALEALRAQLHGPAVRPTDAGYEDVRATFNAMHAGRPDVAKRRRLPVTSRKASSMERGSTASVN